MNTARWEKLVNWLEETSGLTPDEAERVLRKYVTLKAGEINGRLSAKAQRVWPDAAVWEYPDSFVMKRPGQPDVSLGWPYQSAFTALESLLTAARARG